MKRIFLTTLLILALTINSLAQFIGIGLPLVYRNPLNLSTLSQLQAFGGLTFYKDYVNKQASANADFSVGSGIATVTAARSNSAPATYFTSAGLIQTTTTANVPRWTQGYYDSTGFHLKPGIIVESGGNATTGKNNIIQSEVFTDAAWVATTLTVTSGVTDGVLNSTVSVLSATAPVSKIIQAVVDVVAGKYTASIFIKRKTGTGTISLRANTADSLTDITASVGVNWTRVQVTSSSAINPTFELDFANSGDEVYAFGAMLEKTPYSTTYVPTLTAAKTRASETLSYVNTGNRTAAQESIFIKFTPLGSNFANDSVQRTFIDSDTKQRQMYKVNTSTGTRIFPNITDNASVFANNSTTTPSAGTSYILAATMQQSAPNNYATVYYNGNNESGYTAGSYTTPAWGTNFYLGCRSVASSGQLNGIIESVAFYSTWQTDPNVNHISYIMSPGTVTYKNYIFTPSTPSASNLVSGSAGTGNVIASQAGYYNWHEHYACGDVGWTLDGQTGETFYVMQTVGSDAQVSTGSAVAPVGDIIMRTYTKSTNTMSDPPVTVWTDATYMAINDNYILRNPSESFFRFYFFRARRDTPTVTDLCLMKSTDLTASSWGAPVVIMSNVVASIGGFLNSATSGKQLLVLLGSIINSSGAIYSTTDNGDTFTYYSTITTTTANNQEGEFINAPDGTGKIIGVLRNGAGDFLEQVTSSDWGLTWNPRISTGLGASTGAKVTPKLKRAAGDLSRVMVYFYDRGDNRLKVGTPTKFDDAFNGTWLGTYLIGTASQGNGSIFPIDFTLRRYIVSTNTGAEPTNAFNWWIYKDIYTWVQQ